MPPTRHSLPLATLAACAAIVASGCHANGVSMPTWGGTARVPPPTTSSYGTAAAYYPKGANGSMPPGNLPPGSLPPASNSVPVNGPPTVPATGNRPSFTTGASFETPVNSPAGYPPAGYPPPSSVTPNYPASGYAAPGYAGPGSGMPGYPGSYPAPYAASPIPTVPPTTSPNLPPTYLSTPARVDQVLQPGVPGSGVSPTYGVQPSGAYDLPPSPAATIPNNNLRWGTR